MLCRLQPIVLRVETHVEWLAAREAEAAPADVEMERAEAEIEENAVDGDEMTRGEDAAQLAEVSDREREAAAVDFRRTADA